MQMICLLLIAFICTSRSEKINGLSYVGSDSFQSSKSILSFQRMLATNINYVSIVNSWYQENINSTVIPNKYSEHNNSDIAFAVNLAKAARLKVALKPHVGLYNDSAHWRGEIGTFFNSSQWNEWFSSYQSYILEMASLAESTSCDFLIVGTELTASESQEKNWRNIISRVRKVFSGTIIYGTNWAFWPDGPWKIKWWDTVDIIGVDAYFPLSNQTDPTVDEIEFHWNNFTTHLQNLSKHWNMSILFSEIGYQSTNDTAEHPWQSNGDLDLQTQANCYSAAYSIPFSADWNIGIVWWAWDTDPDNGGSNDRGFSPNGKPAESIIQKYSKV